MATKKGLKREVAWLRAKLADAEQGPVISMGDDPQHQAIAEEIGKRLAAERALDRSVRDCCAGTLPDAFLEDTARFEAEVQRRKAVYLR